MARLSPQESAGLVRAAAAGDRAAWERLVDGYIGLIWATARSHGLSAGDAHDISQTTWLRLVEHIDRLDDPASVGAWLATTARHECLRLLRQTRRTVPFAGGEWFDEVLQPEPAPDEQLLREEQGNAVREGLECLSPTCQALLHLLSLEPRPSYEEISAALGMPIGGIGPTRGRCLRKLEDIMVERGITRRAPSVL